MDHELERDALAARPVSDPVRQLGGGHRSITDELHVGTGISQAHDCARVDQHFSEVFHVALHVTNSRQSSDVRAISCGQEVVHSFLEGHTALGRQCSETLLRRGLVVDDVVEGERTPNGRTEQLIQVLHRPGLFDFDVGIAKNRCPYLGVTHGRSTFVNGQIRDL